MSFVKIHETLYVVEQSVKTEKVVETRNSVNHIWIFDRSGSMWNNLKPLTDQMIHLSEQIPKGDTLTIGWFSSKGDRNFILKGFKISDDSDYAILKNVIRKNNTTRGLTCFSEIISDTKQVIEDLSVFSDIFSYHFFTDGFPNQDSPSEIFDAISTIKGKLTSAMYVGFGNYYNKELLSKMAEKTGAMLIHSSMIPEYTDSIIRLMDLSGSVSPKQQILPPVEDPIVSLTVTDAGVTLLAVEDGFVSVAPQGKRTKVYYISKDAPSGDEEIDIAQIDEDSPMMTGIYAASLALTQKMKTDVALELMGTVGDKNMIDQLTNAFTIDEFGRTEKAIEQAVNSTGGRFLRGKDTNYLPPADAFCVFDILEKLMTDDGFDNNESAMFFPYHKGFKYTKVSRPTKKNDDYAKFEASDTVACPIDDLVWNKNRLNLSVRAVINGSITLKHVEDVKPSEIGLADDFPVFIYRNYTFVKDGIVNVEKVYVSTSLETRKYFEEKGIVIDDGDDFDCDGVYGINLYGIPSINRALAEGNTSGERLCTLLKRDNEIAGELKALKFYLNDEYGDDKTQVQSLNDKQVEYLESNGVDITKGGVYSPPSESVPSDDVYVARTFDIKIKGLSSLPALSKVQKKLDENKNRTLSESVVEVGMTKFGLAKDKYDDRDMLKVWLEKEIGKLKGEQKILRQDVQRTKFAIILGRKTFDEFDSREDNVIDYDGWKFTFAYGEKLVNI